MGGVVAVHIALERPDLITHLILTVTCGGLNLAALGAEDWSAEFETHNPNLPRWFVDDQTDLPARLHELKMPVLLLWGCGSDQPDPRWPAAGTADTKCQASGVPLGRP